MRPNATIFREATIFSPSWASNGHWLVRRSAIDAHKGAAVTHTDKKLASAIAHLRKGKLVRCDIQPWLYGPSRDAAVCRCFLDEKCSVRVWLNEKYVQGLDLNAVWVAPSDPLNAVANAPTFAKATVFIMPMLVSTGSLRRLIAASRACK